MPLKPWYKVVTPREDLREGKPLDASEFAVHLDQVRDGRAPSVYQRPAEFFERTYLTESLAGLAAEAVRRLSGIKTETSAVFNMSTQFGGGKSHALTMLYHLGAHGPAAGQWVGVNDIRLRAGVESVPQAAVAVFVGTEFDSLTGRGGDDGTPLRRTPWGEVAFQLGGSAAFDLVAEHERQVIAPGGDVITKMLPKGKPCLILMDELMNYVSRYRKMGLSAQLYDFLQNLSETVRGQDNAVLAVSIPASEMEMTADDQSDYTRLKKMLDRLGKPVIMSAEAEASEIIRRRLFEWGGLPAEARKTAIEYADWIQAHRQQVPGWFPVDSPREAFEAAYPFHPSVISVFERKWQALPRFQRTRGVLRMLALWVSRAYQDGFKRNHRDPLIGLGTAPLEDPMFRTAVFEQLGETDLEGPVTTDVCGKKESHAIRLDTEAVDTIKKARLHRKVATAIFFESNGGQARAEATAPEIRLAVAEPDLDIGNVETVLDDLTTTCYFLSVEKNAYRFGMRPNLNKIFADRRATIKDDEIDEAVRSMVQDVFSAGPSMDRVFFPEKSIQIPNRPVLTLVIAQPEFSLKDRAEALQFVETMTREYGSSGRTYKSALVWCLADDAGPLSDSARKQLTWETIEDEYGDAADTRLDEKQKREMVQNLKRARGDLKEAVWRTYKHVLLLGKDNRLRDVDLGLVHSSAAASMVEFVLNRLRGEGDVEKSVSPNFLVRNWPPALPEWSTKAVRDAFFASPLFPRLLNAEAIRETIALGVERGQIGYVGKAGGLYKPFCFGQSIGVEDIEISEDVFIVTRETAENYQKSAPAIETSAGHSLSPSARGDAVPSGAPDARSGMVPPEPDLFGTTPPTAAATQSRVSWQSEVSTQKWMNFYTKILSRFAADKNVAMRLRVGVEIEGKLTPQKIEEIRIALRELGLPDDLS